MFAEILKLIGIEDLSGIPPDLQFCITALFVLFLLSECFALLRIVLYRIFGGDR